MAEVVLGVDLEKYGSLISKTPASNLTIRFDWDHTGAAITFEAWVSTGHRGIAIDTFGKRFAEDGPGPVRVTGLSCPQDDTKKGYYHQFDEPLSTYYGANESISDGAIRVVFKIPGQADRAGYLWNAFKIAPVAEEYALSGAVSPAVGGISGLGDYAPGTSVTITAFLDSWAFGKYTFDHWGGDASGTSPTTTVYMDRDKHVIAYFKEVVVEKYTLTLDVSPSGAGSVSGAGDYARNTWATIIASETNPDYEFDHWGGDYYGTSKTATVYMAFDKHITAYFKPKVAPGEFQLIVVGKPAGYGTATKSPSKTRYAYGEVVTCTAHPAVGHAFSYWDCDGEWISSATSFNFMVLADHTLTAWFN